ncbi:mitochondrial ribonuclease P catalytic subunit [Vespula squamosa]|uniref:ribonuclease P n=1 Tax=Vespula squamosa TaxID=30214 RepID=A0ABD2AF48_VESSQ
MEFISTSIRFLLYRRNLLSKQIINKIQRISTESESLEIKKTLFPLLDTNYPSQDLCFNVRNDIINKHSVSEHVVDMKILEIFIQENKFESAQVYFRHLKSNNYPLNHFILIKYLKLLSAKETSISKLEEEEILHIYDIIKKKYEYIPPSILLICVSALCLTSKWEIVYDIIKYNGDENIDIKILVYVAATAFERGKANVGFEFINKIQSDCQDMHKRKIIYDKYLNYYLKNEENNLNYALEKMFHFWKKHDIVPIKSIIDNFVDTCKESKWEAHHVQITHDGQCSHCNNYLSRMAVENDVNKLLKFVLSEIMIGNDIFQTTTPNEFIKFKQFIDKGKPFDIVIDGLNMAYIIHDKLFMQNILLQFVNEHKKILIITRKHKYNSIKWMVNLDNIFIYLLKDITEDDPYILYATLASGNNAKFMSLDLLRQHYNKLKDVNMQKEFMRWQLTHRYSWNCVNRMNILVNPISYNPYAQVKNGHWHIPYTEANKLLYKPTDTWVCLYRSRN